MSSTRSPVRGCVVGGVFSDSTRVSPPVPGAARGGVTNYRGNIDSLWLLRGRGSPPRDKCPFPPKYVECLVFPPGRFWNGMRTAVKSWCDARDGIPQKTFIAPCFRKDRRSLGHWKS